MGKFDRARVFSSSHLRKTADTLARRRMVSACAARSAQLFLQPVQMGAVHHHVDTRQDERGAQPEDGEPDADDGVEEHEKGADDDQDRNGHRPAAP